MILVDSAPGGLYLRRSDSDAAPLFVADDEVAAAIADMLARSDAGTEMTAWDTWAALCGNDAAALA